MTASQELGGELHKVLDQELERLPDKYRVVVVLCDLEGKTRKEAARHLSLPDGTVASRLAAARTMLAKRLTRRGFVLSGGTVAAGLTPDAVSAAVSTSIVSATIQAASALVTGQAGTISGTVTALTEVVLKAMFLSKLKNVATLFTILAVTCYGAYVLGAGELQVVAEKGTGTGAAPARADFALVVNLRLSRDEKVARAVDILDKVKARGATHTTLRTAEEGEEASAEVVAQPDTRYDRVVAVVDALRSCGIKMISIKATAREEKTGVAWGKVKDELQAGLALRPGDKHLCQVGDTVRFVLKVRNVSDRPVEMPYLAVARDARVGPSVLDADGNRLPMSGPAFSSVGGRAISKLKLAPGQEVEFAVPELILGPVGEARVQPSATVQAGPGTFRVSYHVFYVNADETGNFITSGEVQVQVTQERPKKD
jgi:hypothetical protein